jgi:hypothetical protein
MPATLQEVPLAQARARTTIWAGVMSIAGLSLWLAVVGLRDLLRARDLWRAVETARGQTVGPALVVTVVALLAAEQRWPAVRRPLLARAHLVDGCFFLLFAIAVVPVLTLVETGFAIEIERHASFLVLGRLALAPRLVVVTATLVGIDGMNWCAHVANHRFATLWRLGFVLVIWDQLARRAELPVAGPPVLTGIAGRPVPVEQAVPIAPGKRRPDLAHLVLAQLAQPFRRYSTMDGPP